MKVLRTLTKIAQSIAGPLHDRLEMSQFFDIKCQEASIKRILEENNLDQLEVTHWYSEYYTKTFLSLKGEYLKSQESAFKKAFDEIVDKVIRGDELLRNFFRPRLDRNSETDYVLVNKPV